MLPGFVLRCVVCETLGLRPLLLGMTMTENRILPKGSQFHAIVNGKPTGLAGCSQSAACDRAAGCLRADLRLTYRAEMRAPGAGECSMFIRAGV